VTFGAAFVVSMVTLGLLSYLPIPYVLEGPGPTVDVLGSTDGHELIQVPGEPSHPVTGALLLTTVVAHGSDLGSLSAWQLITGYFNASEALLPYDVVYPRDSTAEERQALSEQQMLSSQETATAAALQHLGMDIGVVVEETRSESAKEVFQVGDRFVTVGGAPIHSFADLQQTMADVEPGAVVDVVVLRAGVERTLSAATTTGDSGEAVFGLGVGLDFPVDVEFGVDDIGGPSAGAMFALGIIDKLGPTDLAAGHVIAGTGTVEQTGAIGAIGGIEQKMIAARRDGAEVFLAPADNCAEVVGHEPAGLLIVKVATLDDAVAALAEIAAGDADRTPRCG
jgi:PDZ domain-containing protein